MDFWYKKLFCTYTLRYIFFYLNIALFMPLFHILVLEYLNIDQPSDVSTVDLFVRLTSKLMLLNIYFIFLGNKHK